MSTFGKWTVLLCVMSLLSRCATTDWCAGNRAIRPTAEDVATMSSGTARQLLEHKNYGADHCGWKP
jgi:3-hydroxy-3-methylglutaryl CoA synthase